MNREELIEAMQGSKFMKKLAAQYIRTQNMDMLAQKFATTREVIEDIFIDYPELEEQFDEAVNSHSSTLAHRKIRAGVDEAIGKLNELITDPDEDPQTAYRAANALLSVWAKVSAKTPGEGKDKKDDLDEIWDMIQDETKPKKDFKDS